MDVSGQLHTQATLPLGNEPWYPLDRRVGRPHSWSGCGAKEKYACPCQKSKGGFNLDHFWSYITTPLYDPEIKLVIFLKIRIP
jgi:hypothetical protein